MKRELNPNLFGANEVLSGSLDSDLEFPKMLDPTPLVENAVLKTKIKELEKQIGELRGLIQQTEAKMAQYHSQMAEINKTQTLRLERWIQSLTRLEQIQQHTTQEFNEKYAQLAGRVNERRLADVKIEELIDRHNQLVQSFEVRMKQTQKMISERDFQVLKAVAALEDARRS